MTGRAERPAGGRVTRVASGTIAAVAVALGSAGGATAHATTREASRAAAAAPMLAPRSAALASCLLGRWTEVSESEDVELSGTAIVVRGDARRQLDFYPDGTEIVNYADAAPLVGDFFGKPFALTVRGDATYFDTARSGILTFLTADYVTLAESATLGGVATSWLRPVAVPPAVRYSCTSGTLVESSAADHFAADFRRLASSVPLGPFSSPPGIDVRFTGAFALSRHSAYSGCLVGGGHPPSLTVRVIASDGSATAYLTIAAPLDGQSFHLTPNGPSPVLAQLSIQRATGPAALYAKVRGTVTTAAAGRTIAVDLEFSGATGSRGTETLRGTVDCGAR
ncbi:MAG TPA: hypothetical protein VND23_07475 [Acidimicrobiales bacterium]|nr:hypothetical protein [Acidimicrobiales bacterium]